jgi:hypothetical protein
MYRDVDCPYCGAGVEINHDDGYGYEEDTPYEQYCSDCDKSFIYYTSIHFSYDAQKADCLNDKDHDWVPMECDPILWPNAVRCSMCDEEKKGEPDWEAYEAHMKTRKNKEV